LPDSKNQLGQSSTHFFAWVSTDIAFASKLFENINRKELRITGYWMSYSESFPGKKGEVTAYYFSTGRLKFDKNLIFKKFPLCEIKKGFDMYKKPGDVKGKILLVNK